jgi:hypothetical protein
MRLIYLTITSSSQIQFYEKLPALANLRLDIMAALVILYLPLMGTQAFI